MGIAMYFPYLNSVNEKSDKLLQDQRPTCVRMFIVNSNVNGGEWLNN